MKKEYEIKRDTKICPTYFKKEVNWQLFHYQETTVSRLLLRL